MSKVGRDDGIVIDKAVESSHWLVGNLIEWAGCRGDQAANRTRMDRQLAALDQFKTELLALDPPTRPSTPSDVTTPGTGWRAAPTPARGRASSPSTTWLKTT